jgi:hypothetical protein
MKSGTLDVIPPKQRHVGRFLLAIQNKKIEIPKDPQPAINLSRKNQEAELYQIADPVRVSIWSRTIKDIIEQDKTQE